MRVLFLALSLLVLFPGVSGATLPRKLPVISQIEMAHSFPRREMTCVALTIYHEARGSIEKDQIAVAYTVMNRLANRYAPTACQVLFQKYPEHAFPWANRYLKSGRIVPRETEAWERVQAIAYKVYTEQVPDPTHGATYFHHIREHPSWSRVGINKTRIADHIFMGIRKHEQKTGRPAKGLATLGNSKRPVGSGNG